MKVFLSWSGDRSKLVAELLHEWIKCVIQSVHPWVSSHDIMRGELWYNAITNEVSNINTGIICLTKENKDRPWILFEAGALAKGISTNHIITFLIDLEPTDLATSPLSAFNHTFYSKEGVFKMIATINALTLQPLEDAVLVKVFEMFWPIFEARFNAIIAETMTSDVTPKPAKKDTNTVLIEQLILTVKNLEKMVYNGQINKEPAEFANRSKYYGNNEIINKGKKVDFEEIIRNMEVKFRNDEIRPPLDDIS